MRAMRRVIVLAAAAVVLLAAPGCLGEALKIVGVEIFEEVGKHTSYGESSPESPEKDSESNH